MSDKELLGEYKLVLGLEVHFHVKTKFKMFSRVSANIYDSEPNTHVSPTCMGLPGALPVPNFNAVKKTQLLGIALNCHINKNSKFDRKHYFYPDLPKGYQISQYKEPLCEGGHLVLENGFRVEMDRIHLEEDTAQSYHENGKTLIDFNKSGMPLLELVTKPIFRSVIDASNFAREVREITRYLDISDADMEKGQMRVEPNISLRTAAMELEDILPTYKVEIKNINSFKFMEKAVRAEIVRQRALLDQGKELKQENRGYDEAKKITVAQRSKEDAHDYRYFPEPDIPPMVFDDKYIEDLKLSLKELPSQVRARLVTQYGLNEQSAKELTRADHIELLDQFGSLVNENLDPQNVANLLLNKQEFRGISVEVFKEKLVGLNDKVSDEETLRRHISKVLKDNQDAVESYKKGKESSIKFLLGQVMRETKGKADATITLELLKRSLPS